MILRPWFVLATFAAVTAAEAARAGAASGVAVPEGDLPGWRLLVTDDFSGEELDRSLWWRYSGEPTGSGSETFWYGENVVVRDGLVEFQTYPDPKRCGLWASGGIGMKREIGGQVYGKYLVRFRCDPSEGVACIGMLWPVNDIWPPEVDFFEDFGGNRSKTKATLHYGEPGDRRLIERWRSGDFTEWHTLGVEWTPGKLVYTMDGEAWGVVESEHVPDIPMRLQMQSQQWDESAEDTFVRMQIDWIAVYAYDPESAEPEAGGATWGFW